MSAKREVVLATVLPTTSDVPNVPVRNFLLVVPRSILFVTLGTNVELNTASVNMMFAVVPLPAPDPNITCVTAFAPVPKLIVSATLNTLPLTVLMSTMYQKGMLLCLILLS